MSVQVRPSPEYPGGQAPHLYEPDVFTQLTRELQAAVPLAHSSMSWHPVLPSPVYPGGQALQVNEPAVFVHAVSGSHAGVGLAHSLTSTHLLSAPPV